MNEVGLRLCRPLKPASFHSRQTADSETQVKSYPYPAVATKKSKVKQISLLESFYTVFYFHLGSLIIILA